MPQFLSRVKPNVEFIADANVLDDKPELCKLVANIFANSGITEWRLSYLLVRILGADADPAIAMFSTLTAQHLQFGALEAAAKVALTSEEYRVFQATMRVNNSVQTPRHHLAHWIWGRCKELPDALLLAEPKAQKERDRALTLALEKSNSHGLDFLEFLALNRYDPNTVQVYRKGDLERASADLTDCAQVAFLTVIYLDGLFRGRRKVREAIPGSNAKLRPRIFDQLYAIRLFRKSWDRLAPDSNTNPLSLLGSPSPEPSE